MSVMPETAVSDSAIVTAEPASGARATVLAWDLPTRLAKWTLAALVGLAFVSKYYGDVGLVWHRWNGLVILVVVVFRLLWGVLGGTTARFADFVRGPKAAFTYLRGLVTGRGGVYLGHNPLGGWMVVALLAAVLAQAVSGLFTSDDIMVDGPLVSAFDSSWTSLGSMLHQRIYPILLALIALHVGVNLLYTLFKDNLLLAIIVGRKPRRAYVDHAAARPGSVVLALTLLLVSVAIVFGGIWALGGNPIP